MSPRPAVVTPGFRPGLARERLRMSGHTSYRLYAHVTWHTRLRVGCLDSSAREDVVSAVSDAAERCSVHVLRGAVLADHVHLLVSIRPWTRLSDFVGFSKTLSSWLAGQRAPGAVRWCRGFCVQSLSLKDVPKVDRYVSSQHLRHPDSIPKGIAHPSAVVFGPVGIENSQPRARARGQTRRELYLQRFREMRFP